MWFYGSHNIRWYLGPIVDPTPCVRPWETEQGVSNYSELKVLFSRGLDLK